MKWPRAQFTIRWLMLATVLASLLLAVVVAKRERNQRLVALSAARAAYQNARLTRAVAEVALVEYEQTIFPQEARTIQDEIALADSDLMRAEDRLEWSRHMIAKGYLPRSRLTAEESGLSRAEFAAEQARTKQKVLEHTIKDRTVKEMRSEVETARAEELARKAVLERLMEAGTGRARSLKKGRHGRR